MCFPSGAGRCCLCESEYLLPSASLCAQLYGPGMTKEKRLYGYRWLCAENFFSLKMNRNFSTYEQHY